MPKLKTHKGTVKRMKVTASGKVKYRKAGKSHLNSVLTGAKNRQLRSDGYVSSADIGHFERMLHRRLRPGK